MRRFTQHLVVVAFAATFANCELPSQDLGGLWGAGVRLGPDIRGPLFLLEGADGWRADFAGFSVPVRVDGRTVSFELPDSKGSFRGQRSAADIVGHWIQPITMISGRAMATPVTLKPDGKGRWRGEVTPLEDRYTFYLPVTANGAGGFATYLRNPERNEGRFAPVSRISLQDGVVRLFGRTSAGQSDTTFVTGVYRDGTIRLPLRGKTFNFVRIHEETSPFYPRRKSGERYRYTAPIQLDDGWPVASLEEVDIAREPIERFIQMLIDMPMDSIGTPQIHSVLIARHGKLVLEEYFHGYHRALPHDTRSASKSWIATLIGASMHAGIPIRLDTPVYQTMLGTAPADLDPRKRAMTLEHLVSMTAGYDCDGRKPNAPGREDVMQQQTAEPDWYRYTLNLPMASAPGDTILYCDIEPNLAGGVLAKVAREPLPELFHRLVAQPLQMSGYHLLLQPTGEAYGGGGHYFLARDFMKLAQLMVDGGKWNGRQVFSSEWARMAGAALRSLSPTQQYGFLWNSHTYPHGDRKVRGTFAAGNGGQIFMAIPDLDLVIAFTGGAYGDRSLFIPQRVYVPEYLLPAVK